MALAGVIGGAESGIGAQTTTIIFESANFEPANIRKTSTKLGARTESSARFEKSLDPNWCKPALEKAVELTLAICPGAKVASRAVDVHKFHLKTGPIVIPWNSFYKKIGAEIPKKTVVDILEHLGFEIKQKSDSFSVKIPTWRATKDISITEDIVEEVSRIYGYDNIAATLPSLTAAPPEANRERQLEWQSADVLTKEFGYFQMCNYSFVSGAQVKKMGDNLEEYLELDNPLSKEKPFLRRYLLTNLLENVERGLANEENLRLYEVGKVFLAEKPGPRVRGGRAELLPRQDTWLAAIYVSKKDEEPFWEARRAAESVFETAKMDWELAPARDARPWEHPLRLGRIKLGAEEGGQVFELNPLVARKFGIEARVGVFEVNLTKMAGLKIEKTASYEPLPVYPDVERDLALVVARDIQHRDLVEALLRADKLVKKAELFDVYTGKGIGDNKKSLAYHLTFREPKRTLTAAEVDAAMEKIKKMLKQKFGAEIRS